MPLRNQKNPTGAAEAFALLALCCRWPLTDQLLRDIAAKADGIDWTCLEKMARRHRVEALAWHALKKAAAPVPEEAAAPLRRRAAETASANLVLAAEYQRLKQGFEEAGISLLFVKGLSIGAIAFDTILLKSAWDVDLLVKPGDVAGAGETLRRLGYHSRFPSSQSAADLEAWHAGHKESVWYGRSGIVVELHSALADHPMVIPGIGMDSPRQEVALARGISVPTLAEDELFAYLCVHGNSSAWFRLKWLADIAAFLAARNEGEVERLYRRSQELGAGRAPAAAILLAHEYLGTRADPALLRSLPSDPGTRWLVRAARRSMAGRSMLDEIDTVRLGTLWIHLAQFATLPSLSYKITEARRQIAKRGLEQRG